MTKRRMSMKKMADPQNIRLRKQSSTASVSDIYAPSTTTSRTTSVATLDRNSAMATSTSSFIAPQSQHSSFYNPSATPYPQVASYPGNQSFIHASSSPMPFIPGKSSTPDVANYAKWPQKGDGKACFGVPMDHVKKLHGIPIVVEECIAYLENYGLREEGILRLAGSSDEVAAVKQTYNSGSSPDFGNINDPNTVAGALKMYFRDLPNNQKPLLMTTGIRSVTNLSEEEAASVLRHEMTTIPELNRDVLKRLFTFLYAVAENVDANRMTPNNIAIVFGPTLAIQVPVLEIIINCTPQMF